MYQAGGRSSSRHHRRTQQTHTQLGTSKTRRLLTASQHKAGIGQVVRTPRTPPSGASARDVLHPSLGVEASKSRTSIRWVAIGQQERLTSRRRAVQARSNAARVGCLLLSHVGVGCHSVLPASGHFPTAATSTPALDAQVPSDTLLRRHARQCHLAPLPSPPVPKHHVRPPNPPPFSHGRRAEAGVISHAPDASTGVFPLGVCLQEQSGALRLLTGSAIVALHPVKTW